LLKPICCFYRLDFVGNSLHLRLVSEKFLGAASEKFLGAAAEQIFVIEIGSRINVKQAWRYDAKPA
jgi:hypothetical protein